MKKEITITSDIFANEWAESFLKALMGNEDVRNGVFVGYTLNHNKFILEEGSCYPSRTRVITFNLDELSVDCVCLLDYVAILYANFSAYGYSIDEDINWDYLAKQKGIEIK